MVYNSIRKKDFENKLISDYQWSGNEILDRNMRNVLISLNNADNRMWMKGVLGKV